MLLRLAHIQTTLNQNEKDEVIGDLLSQLTAAKQIISKYIEAHGLLPEFQSPIPAPTTGETNGEEGAAPVEPEAGG